VFKLITGLSADISFNVLKEKKNFNDKVIAGLTGVIMSLNYFGTTAVATVFFYKSEWMVGSFSNHGTFIGVIYFGWPWTIFNAYFGVFTAHAIYFFSNNITKNSN